jgi:hypothetical protein
LVIYFSQYIIIIIIIIIILQLSTTQNNEVSVLEREGGQGWGWRTKGSTVKHASILREGNIFRLLCWGEPSCSQNIGDGPIKSLLMNFF